MDRGRLNDLLENVARGQVSVADACAQLKSLPYQDLDFAKVDLHRSLRQGFPEVIYCPGKTSEQIVAIAQNLKANHNLVVATRAEVSVAAEVMPYLPGAEYFELAKMIVWKASEEAKPDSYQTIAILAAGTADLPVAEEAACLLLACGQKVSKVYDVGVAGIHRLLDNVDELLSADAVIVIAGMDGALASVVGGIVACPVIAVPTSVGYGASFDGLAALLSMLNSCAAGLTVVNIDNGFGAAMAALRLVKK
jgi:NCAIR mutase (PurE)-related protein